jgi:hypothetical protein
MPAATATPPVMMQGPAVTGPGSSNGRAPLIPFRRATVERSNILPGESVLLSPAYTSLERTIEGTGFLYNVRLQITATTAGNAATVVFAEDAPWNALGLITLRDPNGELINLPNGFYLYLANLAQKNYANRWLDQSTQSLITPGVGAGLGGSFQQYFDVLVGTNRRDLTGIVGNQDRSVKYTLRTDVNPGSVIYTTPPTTLPTMLVNKWLETYSVPLPVGPNGVQQQVLPDGYGTLHFTTVTTSDAAPLGGSTVNHYLRRIGNTIRFIVLVFRSNNLRATAETNAPSLITFKVGDDTVFTETYANRKTKMYERYGFDFPSGVLVYDALHDFSSDAGFELGDDYYHTQALVNAQFQITYPAGFGSTANSLVFLTDDLVYNPPS